MELTLLVLVTFDRTNKGEEEVSLSSLVSFVDNTAEEEASSLFLVIKKEERPAQRDVRGEMRDTMVARTVVRYFSVWIVQEYVLGKDSKLVFSNPARQFILFLRGGDTAGVLSLTRDFLSSKQC